MEEKKCGYIIYNLPSPEISAKVHLPFGDMNANEAASPPRGAAQTWRDDGLRGGRPRRLFSYCEEQTGRSLTLVLRDSEHCETGRRDLPVKRRRSFVEFPGDGGRGVFSFTFAPVPAVWGFPGNAGAHSTTSLCSGGRGNE